MKRVHDPDTHAKPDAAWSEARPATVPRATYAPAATAFGLTFLLWGLVTSPVVLGVGAVVVVLSIASWIGEMTREE